MAVSTVRFPWPGILVRLATLILSDRAVLTNNLASFLLSDSEFPFGIIIELALVDLADNFPLISNGLQVELLGDRAVDRIKRVHRDLGCYVDSIEGVLGAFPAG